MQVPDNAGNRTPGLPAHMVVLLAMTWPLAVQAADAAGLAERFGPLAGSVALSFIAGFIIGRIARKTITTAAIVAAVAMLGIYLLGRFGVDGSNASQWVDAGSAWVGETVEGGGRYLASFLPSAGAAAVGGFLGFKR